MRTKYATAHGHHIHVGMAQQLGRHKECFSTTVWFGSNIRLQILNYDEYHLSNK